MIPMARKRGMASDLCSISPSMDEPFVALCRNKRPPHHARSGPCCGDGKNEPAKAVEKANQTGVHLSPLSIFF